MTDAKQRGVVAYMAFRMSHAMFEKAPDELEAPDSRRLAAAVSRQVTIEGRILASPEARDVIVPEASIANALDQLRARYDGEEDFRAALAAQGFSEAALRQALARELRVEAVLERVSSSAAAGVSQVDVELHYRLNSDSYRQPELRKASHILVTINQDYAENRRQRALERIGSIHERLVRNPARFAEQALKHSECPTALNGGTLGEFRRGQLYAELDAALFGLAAGALSGVVESELGLHLIRCDEIRPGGIPPLEKIAPGIRAVIEAKRRRQCQRAWLRTLLGEPSDG